MTTLTTTTETAWVAQIPIGAGGALILDVKRREALGRLTQRWIVEARDLLVGRYTQDSEFAVWMDLILAMIGNIEKFYFEVAVPEVFQDLFDSGETPAQVAALLERCN